MTRTFSFSFAIKSFASSALRHSSTMIWQPTLLSNQMLVQWKSNTRTRKLLSAIATHIKHIQTHWTQSIESNWVMKSNTHKSHKTSNIHWQSQSNPPRSEAKGLLSFGCDAFSSSPAASAAAFTAAACKNRSQAEIRIAKMKKWYTNDIQIQQIQMISLTNWLHMIRLSQPLTEWQKLKGKRGAYNAKSCEQQLCLHLCPPRLFSSNLC